MREAIINRCVCKKLALATGFFFICTFFATQILATDMWYDKALKESGVNINETGITDFLQSLHPSPERERQIKALIEQLGHQRFELREAAYTKLQSRFGPVVSKMLTEATQGDDPEIVIRAKNLIRFTSSNHKRILLAVLYSIDKNQVENLLQPIFNSLGFFDSSNDYKKKLIRLAVIATTTTDDKSFLVTQLKAEKDPFAKQLLVAALGKVLSKSDSNLMRPFLDSTIQPVQLEAAITFVKWGDRNSLPTLVALMKAKDTNMRNEAWQVFKSATRTKLTFIPYANEVNRKAQLAKIEKWIKSEGKSIKIFQIKKDAVQIELGRTFVSLYSKHKILELDLEGNVVREITDKKYNGPWGTELLPNGNLLVNWFSSHTVVEYDVNMKPVWKFHEKSIQYPWSVQRLENGNTLISAMNKVFEVTPEGKEVWSHSIGVHHSHARRLKNGNTLIALHVNDGKVVEVDKAGEVIWEMKGLNSPYRVQRLENGNTLITEKGRNRVIEVNPKKEIVWERDGFTSPDSARRLANGNTLVSDGAKVYEVSPSKKIIWERPHSKSIITRF